MKVYLGMDEVNMLRQPVGFEEDTDFGFMALVDTGTAQVSVSFDILLVQN